MGQYNPSAPFILGNEWVGIRDESTQFSPTVNVVESGHTFTTEASHVLQDGRFYVHDMPANTGDAVYVIGLYSTGTEALSGPVERLVIPTESAFVTGASVSSGTAVQALLTPYFGNYVILDTDNAESSLTMGFNAQPYTILSGKRIVRVSLLYAAQRLYGTDVRDNGPLIYLTDSIAPFSGIVYSNGNDIPESGTLQQTAQTLSVSFGEVSRLWQSPATSEILPWNFADLQRFDSSQPGTKLYARIVTGSSYGAPANGIVYIWYAALEVLYTEEQRVILGGNYRAGAANEIQYGANPVRLRTVGRALNPTLPAGDWTVTVSAADQGAVESGLTGYPDMNALRELYQIPSLAGVQLNLTQTVGEEFEAIPTHVLTQLSLHASGGTLTEVHSYGRQYPAPVYGSVTATQEIYDDVAGGAATYPQVRFWARHFNGTTQPLTLTGVGALSGSTASITVDAFDQLDEIVDGWKEVNLRFDTPPTMGASAPDPQWTWSAVGEVAGARWEVLAMQAPAVSGIPGDLLNLVTPASQRLPTATYEPPVGATVELVALSTYASGGPAAQNDVDAAVLFSQDPYTVEGFALTLAQQTVTGIGVPCGGQTPCCIPTAIDYVRLTWPTLAMSASGFGAFEIQRSDTVTDWQAIMYATSAAATGFSDYEARVGVVSSYRIRVVNLYQFAGAWSATVTGTVPAPGVTVSCDSDNDGAGTLIFTSNEVQSGARNLAYVMQFSREVEEGFAFPEADWQQNRRHYQRDFVTAYRPTERGGEVFSRTVMVQGAAGALPNMANMRSLRDLAWDQLSYVCVRDELGNRWLATVQVPAGSITNRALYLAQITVTEVTATPTEVNP